MRYEINDLLDEGQVERLTAEAFGEPVRKKRLWRRGVALAACAVLAVGVLNFGAIAAEVERMWRYVAGIGAVPADAAVLVQSEAASFVNEEWTYLVDGAYRQGGLVYIPVDVLSKSAERTGDGMGQMVDLRADLFAGETQYKSLHLANLMGPDALRASGNHCVYFRPLSDETDIWLSQHYEEQGYQAWANLDFLFAFPAAEGETYTLRLTDDTQGKSWSLDLRFVQPETVDAVETVWETERLRVTALADRDGTRVTLFTQLRPEGVDPGAWLLSTWGDEVFFVEESGRRVRGVESGTARGDDMTLELVPEKTLTGRVAAIEIESLYYLYALPPDQPGEATTHYRDGTERNLGWTIPLL